MNYYSTPIYIQPSHKANDNDISIDDNYSSVVVYDKILRRLTVIQRDELIYNHDIIYYAKDSRMAERRHIVHLLDAYFFSPFEMVAKPRYKLLGSRLGPIVLSVAESISDIQAHIFGWPTEYDQSAEYVKDNPKVTYTQYKMYAQISGYDGIYTDEEYRLVHELFRLFDGVFEGR